MKKFLHLLPCICLFLLHPTAFGQSKAALEKKRTEIKKEIRQMNSLLFKTKKKKSNALDDLKDLNQKIGARERLIETIEQEAKKLNSSILKNEKQIANLNTELTRLKSDYSEMVVKTYKSKSMQSKTMFLLSSDSFYQAYKRVKYMQQYNDFRKRQGEEIVQKKKTIEKLNDSLAQRKIKKEQLVSEEKVQKEEIEGDKKNQEKLLSTIKKQELKYKRSLLNKQKEEKRLTARIDKLIREAIARANRNKKTETKKSAAEFTLDAEEKKLLANFEQNKGNLPWPVKGVITRKYGVQPHPAFPGIKINSPGLHIVAKPNDFAKCIFDGKVLVVELKSKGKKSVYVQHGSYISTYNNLETVIVKKGDIVKTGAKLGKIFTNKVTGKTKLSFLLYKNTKKLNPSDWIQ